MRPEPAMLGPRADADVEIQYPGQRYQSDTAIAGMWLFLASELLFFGALFLCWAFLRHQHPVGFAQATENTEFFYGSANSVVLLTSSCTFAAAAAYARLNRPRAVVRAALLTAALGLAFLALKTVEWWLDIAAHDVPGASFHAAGPDTGGEQLYWLFYWVATGLHAAHLIVGIALVCWIARRVHTYGITKNLTKIEVVGLYWSFVDMIWLVLYPLIYLAARP